MQPLSSWWRRLGTGGPARRSRKTAPIENDGDVMSILLIDKAQQYAERLAIVAPEGSFSYRQLLEASGRVASWLLNGAADLEEQPVAFLAPPGFQYVALQWGIWRAGGIAVPLSLFHPRPELEYVIEDVTPAGWWSIRT